VACGPRRPHAFPTPEPNQPPSRLPTPWAPPRKIKPYLTGGPRRLQQNRQAHVSQATDSEKYAARARAPPLSLSSCLSRKKRLILRWAPPHPHRTPFSISRLRPVAHDSPWCTATTPAPGKRAVNPPDLTRLRRKPGLPLCYCLTSLPSTVHRLSGGPQSPPADALQI
jgi:hypothetical protein